jgi:hypothetical protein
MSLIRREYALAVAVALVSGIVAIVSLVLPWVNTADKSLNAFQLGDLVAESLNVAFVGTTFGFLAFFGGLMIVGAILMLTGFDSGQFVIYAGAILTIIFAVLGLIVSSIIPLVSPYVGAWLCLCCGVAGVISPKLHVKKAES